MLSEAYFFDVQGPVTFLWSVYIGLEKDRPNKQPVHCCNEFMSQPHELKSRRMNIKWKNYILVEITCLKRNDVQNSFNIDPLHCSI